MPYEDFTSYTEVEPDDRIQATAQHVDAELHLDEDAYLCDDKGSGHFGDFEHKVDVLLDSISADGAYGVVWQLANAVDDELALRQADEKFIHVNFYRTAGVRYLRLGYYDGSAYHVDFHTCAVDKTYYLVIERSVSTLTCKVYDESARTTLLFTLQLTDVTTDAFRYIYACSSTNRAVDKNVVVDVEKLDLQEVTISGVTRDSNGNPLGSCTVWLFKSSDKSFVDSTTSDPTTGAYSFTVVLGIEYFIRAHKDGTPNVFGTTDDNLTGS